MSIAAASLITGTDKKVSDLLAETHSPVKWFQITAVTMLKGTVDDPSQIRPAVAAVCQEIVTRTDRAPYDLQTELAHHEHSKGTVGRSGDLMPWAAKLSGDTTSVAGVYRVSQGPLESGPASYSVVYSGHCQQATDAIESLLAKNPELTVGQLLDSPEYRHARSYAERNALRISAQIGAAIAKVQDKPLSAVMNIRPDELSARSVNDPTAAPEFMAQPDYMHITNYIESNNITPEVKSQHYNTGALFHHGTVDPNVSSHLVGQLAIRDGFFVRNIKPADGVQRVMSALQRSTPAENVTFSADKKKGVEAMRAHTKAIYIAGEGQVPSSSSRPLWALESNYSPKQGDIRLSSVAVYINGAPKVAVK